MALTLKCSECAAVLKTSAALRPGQKINCPRCKAGITVPGTEATGVKAAGNGPRPGMAGKPPKIRDDLDDPDDDRSPSSRSPARSRPDPDRPRRDRDEERDDDEPRRRPDPDEEKPRRRREEEDSDEEDEDRPRKKKKKKKQASNKGLMLGLIFGAMGAVILVMVLVLGFSLGWFGGGSSDKGGKVAGGGAGKGPGGEPKLMGPAKLHNNILEDVEDKTLAEVEAMLGASGQKLTTPDEIREADIPTFGQVGDFYRWQNGAERLYLFFSSGKNRGGRYVNR